MEFLESVFRESKDLISEPWVARLVALLLVGITLARQGYKVYLWGSGMAFRSAEQEQLYKFSAPFNGVA